MVGQDHSRDKSLFLPLDTNEIGVKYEQAILCALCRSGSKYADLGSYTLASKMRTERCLDLACEICGLESTLNPRLDSTLTLQYNFRVIPFFLNPILHSRAHTLRARRPPAPPKPTAPPVRLQRSPAAAPVGGGAAARRRRLDSTTTILAAAPTPRNAPPRERPRRAGRRRRSGASRCVQCGALALRCAQAHTPLRKERHTR